MTDLNSVVIVGRVTKDCSSENGSFGYLQNGTALAKVSVAVNRSRKNQNGEWEEEASFFNVTIFGKLAESLMPKLKKGVQIAVAGSLKQDRWQKDGQNFSSVGIIADSVQVFAPKQQNQGTENNNFVSASISNKYSQAMRNQQNYLNPTPNVQNQQNYQQAEEAFPEDIPF